MTNAGRLIGALMIFASTFAESFGQFAFKRAASHRPVLAGDMAYGPFRAVWLNRRWIFLGFVGFSIDGILWSIALHYLDLTVAHPLGSIVFVVVAIMSRVALKEHISPRRWLGICFVLTGAAIVALN